MYDDENDRNQSVNQHHSKLQRLNEESRCHERRRTRSLINNGTANETALFPNPWKNPQTTLHDT